MSDELVNPLSGGVSVEVHQWSLFTMRSALNRTTVLVARKRLYRWSGRAKRVCPEVVQGSRHAPAFGNHIA